MPLEWLQRGRHEQNDGSEENKKKRPRWEDAEKTNNPFPSEDIEMGHREIGEETVGDTLEAVQRRMLGAYSEEMYEQYE